MLRSGRNPDENGPASKARTDGNFKPDSPCPPGDFDDADDVVFDVLPSYRNQDVCDFETIVKLDENLACQGKECRVDTVRTIEVVPGTYYEYLRPGESDDKCCVFHLFITSQSSSLFQNASTFLFIKMRRRYLQDTTRTLRCVPTRDFHQHSAHAAVVTAIGTRWIANGQMCCQSIEASYSLITATVVDVRHGAGRSAIRNVLARFKDR